MLVALTIMAVLLASNGNEKEAKKQMQVRDSTTKTCNH